MLGQLSHSHLKAGATIHAQGLTSSLLMLNITSGEDVVFRGMNKEVKKWSV